MKLQDLKQQLKQTIGGKIRKVKSIYTPQRKAKAIQPTLKIIGITGSTGKSTTAYIIHEYLKQQGYQSVLYSSICVDSPASYIKKEEAYEVAVGSKEALLSIIEETEACGAEYLVLEINESSIAKGIVKDAFGNCTITKGEDNDVVQCNPIRWKGLYCETESNLYFMDNNTYYPGVRQNLSMNLFENIISNSTSIYSLYPYQFFKSNPVNMVYKEHTIKSELELVFVPKAKSMFTRYWEKFWRSDIGKAVAIRLTIIALVLAIATGNIVGFLITLGVVTATLLIGGINAGTRSKHQGKGGWNGFVNYINDNWSQTLGVEMAIFIVSIGVSELFKNCYTDCFIAGTMVLTSIGLVKIEEVKVGDEVWAYDEETKEKALKKVKQLFRKETKEWVHLFVENPITKETEEIICTPSHRIYIEKKGWIKASDIVENDEVLLYNNTNGIIQRIEIEKLEQPEVTYNFEVEDYHNYFVSEESVLVHNDCTTVNIDGKEMVVYRGSNDGSNIYLRSGEDGLSVSADMSKAAQHDKPRQLIHLPEGFEVIHSPSRADLMHCLIISKKNNIKKSV